MLDIRLTHAFASFTLDVAFSAPKGVTVLFGKSGAGKSTVAKAIAGLQRTTGHVQVGAAVLQDETIWIPPHKRRIGYVFQEPRLFPHLSVARNLTYGADTSDVGQIPEMLDITPLLSRRPANLSGGEASRVALGRALLSDPSLLILDEPLAALDAARKAEILPYLERLRDYGTPMLYITHAMEEVARLGTTLVVLRDGRVVRSGPVAQVLADPSAASDLGPRTAGAVLEGTVIAHAHGLTQIATKGGTLWVPGTHHAVSHSLRVRILAQDVMLANREPGGLSALNILRGTITRIEPGAGPGAMIAIDVGGETILARVTQKSVADMNLSPGQTVWAIAKTVSVGPGAIRV